MCIFANYRNNIEIINKLFVLKSALNYLQYRVFTMSHTWLNKCNYREYIKKILIINNNVFETPMAWELKKVLLMVLIHKGSCHPVVNLVCKFLNLVNTFLTIFDEIVPLKSLLLGFVVKINQVCVFVYLAIFGVYFKQNISFNGKK